MPVGPAPRVKARVVAWDLDSVVKAGPVLTPSRRPSPQHEDLLPEGGGVPTSRPTLSLMSSSMGLLPHSMSTISLACPGTA